MINFIKKILPDRGFYCVAVPSEYGGKSYFKHTFWETPEQAYERALALDAVDETVFFAQATFKTIQNRKQENAGWIRSFFFDIDCGPEKPYATQKDGVDDLKRFCEITGLPMPAVMSSGNGLYTYWPIVETLYPDQWKGVAQALKHIASAAKFDVDPNRTADEASVLRPPGVHNYKKDSKKPVRLLKDIDPIPFDEFVALIKTAAKKLDVKTNKLAAPTKTMLNSEFMEGIGGPPAKAHLIADKCPQIRSMKENKGDVSEPLWYAAIGVLRHVEDGNAVIHNWSSGYPGYTFEETQAKIDQHKMPPTSCAHFGSVSSKLCIGCVHNGKIKTPIVLGREFEAVKPSDNRCPIPDMFMQTEQGLFFKEENIRVYPFDIYPASVSFDESLGYETIRIRHFMPHSGWEEFTIRSSIVHEPKTLLMALHDNHVQVVGLQEKKLMTTFIEQYTARLRADKKVKTLYSQLGWKEKEFVLGSRIFSANSEPVEVGFSENVPEAARAVHSKGDINKWIEATKYLGGENKQGHAFAFLAGVFGAPLMHFTGYSGALISCTGYTGTGKTLTAQWIASAYGNHADLMMVKEDTRNSLITRLGVYGSLPFTIDEITNTDPEEISDLVYRLTQGRDKARLTKNAVERSNINRWSTVSVASSNHSLVDKLSSLKADASAEINRIFEIDFPKGVEFDAEDSADIFWTIKDNYGTVGERYIQYLVDNYDAHAANLRTIAGMLNDAAGIHTSERFWSAIAAVAIYGGLIAKKLGLIKFNVAPIQKWVVSAIQSQRSAKKESTQDPINILGNYLDFVAGQTLVVSNTQGGSVTGYKIPMGQIQVRFEMDTKLIFVNRDSIRDYLRRQHVSYASIKRELMSIQPRSPMISDDKRKSLTAGLIGAAGAPVRTWVLDMTHPAMGNCAVEIVRKLETEKEVAV